MFKLFSFFTKFIILFALNLVLIDAKKCTEKDSEDADICMGKMLMIGDRSQRFRETLDDMHKYCKNIATLQQCVKRYSRECLPPFARQVSNQLLSGVTKVNKPLCLNDESKTSFNKVAKCGNINLESKHKCMDVFIDDLKTTESVDVNKKLPFVCCNFWKFKDCVKQTFDGVDGKKCPKKSVDGVLNLISGYTSDALDLICSDFDDGSEKCKKLIKDQINTNTTVKTKAGRKSKSKSHSILPSFLRIFMSLS